MPLAVFFLPPNRTPEASSLRASGPVQNRVAPALVLRSLRRRRIAGPARNRASHWFSGHFITPPGGGSCFFPRAQEERSGVLAAARTSNQSTVPTHHPLDPARFRVCCLLARSAARNKLRIVPPRSGQMPPHRPCRPDRDAFGPASRPACSPCRHVAALPDQGAHPPPLTRPRPPFNRHAALRKASSEAVLRRSAEMLPLLRSGNRLRSIPGPSQQSPLRRRDPNPPPPSPQGLLPQSRGRDMSAADRCCHIQTPCSSPHRGTPCGMLPHVPPRRFNCTVPVYAGNGALERLPGMFPDSSVAKGTRGHTPRRASSRPRQTGCPCTFRLWQPVRLNSPTPHKLSRKNTPACRPPKGNARSRDRLRPRKLRVIRSPLRAFL